MMLPERSEHKAFTRWQITNKAGTVRGGGTGTVVHVSRMSKCARVLST